MKYRFWILGLAVLLAGGWVYAGKVEYLVYFKNGRVLKVENIYSDTKWTYLVLNVQNQFAVPKEQVVKYERSIVDALQAPPTQTRLTESTPSPAPESAETYSDAPPRDHPDLGEVPPEKRVGKGARETFFPNVRRAPAPIGRR